MTRRALIFDFDGVLVDTEPIHIRAWLEILANLKMSFTQHDYDERYIGLNDREFLAKIFADHGRDLISELTQELIDQKEVRSRNELAKEIPLIKGVQDFLKKGAVLYPMVIVTGALPGEVAFILKKLRWENYFSKIITAADVLNGKPDPEGFLKAFSFLQQSRNWDPPLGKSECLVFEDTRRGVAAARKSGMPVQVVRGELFLEWI